HRARGAADRRPTPDRRGARRAGSAHLHRVRDACRPRSEPGRRLLATRAPRTSAWRRRLPGAANDRRARPPPAREDRAGSERSRAQPHHAGRGLPLPTGIGHMSLPGGFRTRMVIVLVGIVAGALGTAYMIVVPSLERRLVEARLEQLAKVGVPLARKLPDDTH